MFGAAQPVQDQVGLPGLGNNAGLGDDRLGAIIGAISSLLTTNFYKAIMIMVVKASFTYTIILAFHVFCAKLACFMSFHQINL